MAIYQSVCGVDQPSYQKHKKQDQNGKNSKNNRRLKMDDESGGSLFGMPIPPEVAKKLIRELQKAAGLHVDPIDSKNPNKYPRQAKIEDPEILMLLTEYELLREQIDFKQSELAELEARSTAMMARVYRHCNQNYRHVMLRGDLSNPGSGLRKWKGGFHVVGFDTNGQDDEEDESRDNRDNRDKRGDEGSTEAA